MCSQWPGQERNSILLALRTYDLKEAAPAFCHPGSDVSPAQAQRPQKKHNTTATTDVKNGNEALGAAQYVHAVSYCVQEGASNNQHAFRLTGISSSGNNVRAMQVANLEPVTQQAFSATNCTLLAIACNAISTRSSLQRVSPLATALFSYHNPCPCQSMRKPSPILGRQKSPSQSLPILPSPHRCRTRLALCDLPVTGIQGSTADQGRNGV